MKKFFLLILLFSHIFRKDSLKVASTDNFPPINMLDSNKELSGLAKELSDEIFKRADIEIERVTYSSWAKMLKDLKTKKIDAIHDGAYNRDRAKEFKFSKPIFSLNEVIFTRNDRYDINSIIDLKQIKLGCVKKHISYQYIVDNLNLECKAVETPKSALYDLISKDSDALIYPKEVLLYLSQKLDLNSKIKIVGEPLRELKYSMLFRDDIDIEILSRVNLAINSIEQDGTKERILNRYFGERLFSSYSDREFYLLIGTTLFSLITVTLSLFLILLKKRYILTQSTLKQELEISERRWHNIFHSHNGVMMIVDPEDSGKIIDINQAGIKFYGYSKEEFKNLKISDINTLSKDEIENLMQKAKQESLNYFEFKHRLKDGTTRDVEVHSTPINSLGKNLLFSIIHDITSRKLAEKSLKRYKYIISATKDLISLIDRDYNYLLVNRAYLSMFNKSYSQIVGHSIEEFIGEDAFKEKVSKHLKQALNGESIHYQDWFKITDSKKRFLDIIYTPYYEDSNQIFGILATIRDITKQKESEEFLNTLIENSPIGIFTVDSNRIVIAVNRVTTEMFGYSKEEMVGVESKVIHLNTQTSKEFGEKFYPEIRDGKVVDVNWQFKTKKDKLIWCRVVGKAIDSLNLDSGVIWILQDISPQLEYEEKLKNLNRELEIKVIERSKKLKAQDEQIIQQSKMASMGEMIEAIAHQWKQPLNIISILVDNIIDIENLKEFLTADEIEEIEETINDVHRQIQFMSHTIDDFRDFFKPLKRAKVFDVSKECNKILQIMKAQLKKYNIEYDIKIESENLFVYGYPNEFKQVILNIISNSKDAYEERSIKDRKIAINMSQQSGNIYILIEDFAGGVAKELLPNKIFQPYSSTKGDKGTGIGLSLSKKIISENMKGELSVENSKFGAIFKIELPRYKEE